MMSKIYLFLLFIVCCSCSRSFPVRASLDRSRWFASLTNGTPRIYEDEWLSLIFTTDFPHPELAKKKIGKATGCTGECQPTQTLILSRIPLRSGYYQITESGPDSLQHTSVQCSYLTQGIEQVNTRFYNKAEGWLHITDYDSTTTQLKGKFNLRFQASDRSNRSVHFRRGRLDLFVKK